MEEQSLKILGPSDVILDGRMMVVRELVTCLVSRWSVFPDIIVIPHPPIDLALVIESKP